MKNLIRNTLYIKYSTLYLIFLIFCFIMPQTVQAATYYVDKNHLNANDSNAGTETLPWQTLTKAGNTAQAGDTVLVKDGIYNETLKPANSGTAGNLITFKAYPGDECQGEYGGTKNNCKVILDGQNTRQQAVSLYPHSYIRIEGFEIRNHIGDEAIYISHYYNTQTIEGIEIINNYIHHNGDSGGLADGNGNGIYARGKGLSNMLVENNEIYYNGASAILMSGTNIIIRANNIHHNGKDGYAGEGENILIEKNTFYDQFHTSQHQDALDIGWAKNSIIRYNTFSDFTQLCYISGDPGGESLGIENIQIYGNIFYNDKYWTSGGGETQGIWIDARGVRNPSVKNISIHSNTFGWLGYASIWIYDENIDGVTIRDNIFYEGGISIESSGTTPAANLNSDYNLFYNRNRPSYEGSHSITADPQFVNYQRHVSHNFRLQSTSPAINAGDPALASVFNLPSPFVDIDGTTRPQGPRYDIGAYEYISSTPPPAITYGDVSGDGQVSAYDAALTARIAVGLDPVGDKLQVADVSGDGEVSAYDAALIAQKAVGLINKFPVE